MMQKQIAQVMQKLQPPPHGPWTASAPTTVRHEKSQVTALVRFLESAEAARASRDPAIDNRGTLQVGKNLVLRSDGAPVRISVDSQARLIIGNDVEIHGGAHIAAATQITLGHRVFVGPYVTIWDGADAPPDGLPLSLGGVTTRLREGLAATKSGEDATLLARAVSIGDDVCLGARCVILPGVRIGRGAIIGAGAVIHEDVQAYSVVAGQPARLVRQLDPNLFERCR